MEHCIECNSSEVTEILEKQAFQCGDIELIAEMLVFTCANCGYQWTDSRADEAREDAVSVYKEFLCLTKSS
jgi:C4-type Zn-finger protein